VSVGDDMARRNRRVAGMAAGVAVVMLGLAYASVPLYSLFCQVTGFGGTPQRAEGVSAPATNTMMAIRFDANVDKDLGWSFHPGQPTLQVKIGEPSLIHYVAVNTTGHDTTGTAVFNVSPPEAGLYFNKIECFCFTEQNLKAGQRAEMPVQFFIDPAILQDPDARGIREITLSYTFYPATPKPANDQAAVSTN
jgi:cytochrome c oxidase assembly protein subunit 11